MSIIVAVILSTFGVITIVAAIIWFVFYLKGKQFALRDRLQKADAIVVLAGTRGNIQYLDGKICTAVRLYKEGWAPRIICSGKFSVKINEEATLIPLQELETAAVNGRIQHKDVANAARTWDAALGARYIYDRAIQMGVPAEALLIEEESLHTRENAEYVLKLLKEHNLKSIILVTSPFHQQRTYLTFAKVLSPHGIKILNHYADADEWHPMTWFLSKEHRELVRSETKRIKMYRAKGDIL
jgi:uncharacterized SAM-binding protein YcdF (DUF218 family)